MNRLILIFLVFVLNCGQTHRENTQRIMYSDSTNTLLDNVRLAINPKFQDWVLFENGTYIIFDNADTIPDIKESAITLMKEFGPVQVGGSAGDFGVTHLTKTEGWIVSGHCYGMYTYVNPAEMETKTPNDAEIGVFGRSKRDKDGHNPVVVHINRKK